MKKTCLFFCFCFCILFTTKAQWTELTTGVTGNLNAVDFVNDTLGYIGGNGILKPTLLKTINGGTTWTDIAPNVTGNIEDILFSSTLEGLITTSSTGNYIMKTSDGGASWTNVASGINVGCHGKGILSQKNALEFYYFKTNCCYYSSDGGNTWSVVNALSGCTSISFPNTTTGYAVQGYLNPNILRTTDGGLTWSSLGVVCNLPLSFVHFVSSLEGYVSGPNFILKTTDGGVTWNVHNNRTTQVFQIEQVGGKTFLGPYEFTLDFGATIQRIPNIANVATKEASYVTNYGYFISNAGKCHKLDLSYLNNPFYFSSPYVNYVGAASINTIKINTTGTWAVGNFPSWISVSPSSGSGSATLTITVQPNPDSTSRNGFIDLSPGTDPYDISINQAGSILGANWIEQQADLSTQLMAIDFIDDSTGFIGGEGLVRPTLLKTIDRGSTWTDIAPNIKAGIRDILFISNTTGFITTFDYSNLLMKTTDGGFTWNTVTSFPGTYTGKLFRKNNSELYYYGTTYGNGTDTYYSSDGGATWSQFINLPGYIISICFSSVSTGYAIGHNMDAATYLYKTTDGGVSWTNMGQLNSKYPDAIRFTSDLVGYITQENYGYILKTIDGGLSWSITNNIIGGNQLDFVAGRMITGGTSLTDNHGVTCQTLKGAFYLTEASFQGTDHAYAIAYPGSFYKMDLSTLTSTLFVSKDRLTCAGTGATRTVQLEAQGNWTAIADQPWVTITPSSGSGNATLVIQTARSTQQYPRTTNITISSGLYSQKIYVEQTAGSNHHDWVEHDIDNLSYFNSVAFTTDSIGYIGGDGILAPTLLKTTDAGSTWTDVAPQNLRGYISDILFVSPDTGFLASRSDGNFLVKTTDGGNTWNTVTSFPGTCAGKLYQKKTSDLFHYGCNITYRSTDGGLTWSSVSGITWGATAISFGDNNTGYAVNNNPTAQQSLFKTTNGGATWTNIGTISAQKINSLYFSSPTIGYASGDNFVIQTVDGGLKWTIVNNSKGAKKLYVNGSKTFLDAAFMSNDYGATTQTLTNLTNLYDGEAFYNNTYGYAATHLGRFYRMDLALAGAPEPANPASNIIFSSITTNSFQISWTKGNGSSSLVVIREASQVNQDPVDMNAYTANTAFGNGTQIGSGNYVVYAGTGNTVSVAGLNPATEYFVEIFSYNGTGTTLNYLTYETLTGSKTTLVAEPTVASTNLVFSSITETSFQVTWTKGNGTSSLVLIKQYSSVNQDPTDGVAYNASSTYGLGSSIASYHYVIYAATGNTLTVTGLQPETIHYVEVFEYNGSDASTNYLTSSTLSGSASTLAPQPTQAASNLSFTSITSSSFNLSWTNGDAVSNLVLIKALSPVDEDPVDGISYISQNQFGTGAQIGAGNYVVFSMYTSVSNSVTVTGLDPATTYYVEIFAFNGSPTYNNYLTSTTLIGNTTTIATEPQNVSSSLLFNNITQNSFELSWTKGDGAYSLVLVKESSSVDEEPVDFTSYSANTVFAAGAQIGTENYVVYNGSGNTATITGLNPSTGYFVEIYEFNGNGVLTNYLTTVSLAGSTTTSAIISSVLDQFSSEQIRLIPNPTSGISVLEYRGIQNLKEISVVNTIGKTVAIIPLENSNSTSFNISSLESGVYFVFLSDNNNRQWIIRIIKQ